jgi:hypothetical protein
MLRSILGHAVALIARARPTRLLALASLLSGLALSPSQATPRAQIVGSGTMTSCTEQALASALASGGFISFDCGAGSTTIPITSQKLLATTTIIDGGGVITLDANHTTGVFKTANGSSLTIRNLTIRNGRSPSQGGALEIGFWNTLLISGSRFIDNESTRDSAQCDGGGAIFIGGGSTALVEGSTFSGNRANNGGAINSLRSRLSVLSSSFSGNQALHTERMNSFGDCGGGGAIYIDGGRAPDNGGPDQLILRGNTFNANQTNNHGGALFIGLYTGDTTEIDRSSFENNSVTHAASMASSGTGGAIWYGLAAAGVTSTKLALTHTLLASNSAESQGGGLWTSAPTTISNTTITGNRAVNPANLGPDDWRKGNGGGIAVSNSAPVTINNSTIANNRAGFNGGGIAGKTVTIKNTLFASNTADWSIGIMQHCTDALTDAGNNLQYPPKNPNPNYWNETNCSAAIRIADPQLSALASNGGPTKTLALAATSPAIDAGNASTCAGSDQRDISRTQGARCDIGAYEHVSALSVMPSLVGVGEPNVTLTVVGEGFSASSKVRWNGQELPTTVVDSTLLRATVGGGLLSAPGNIALTVSDSSLAAAAPQVVPTIRRMYVPIGLSGR